MSKPGSGFARRVTRASLEKFKALLRQKGEPSAGDDAEDSDAEEPAAGKAARKAADPELVGAESLFQGTSVTVNLPFSTSRRGVGGSGKPRANEGASAGGGPAVGGKQIVSPTGASKQVARGPLLWEKKLSKTDAQRVKNRTKITGNLHLTQAKFRVNRKVIDQKTYFRNSVFSGGSWSVEKPTPFAEIADFEFDISILGKSFGIRRLTVHHKPSGEAGQGNYTTGIRWGEMLPDLMTQVDVTGATLRLYGPPAGTTAPFFIDIV